MKHRWLVLVALLHVAAVAWHMLYWAPRHGAEEQAGPTGPDASEWDAIGLFEPLKTALAEPETMPAGSAERLLDSLRTLAVAFPEHERVQEIFLMGLSQAIYYAHESGEHAAAAEHTSEFYERAALYPESEPVTKVVAALAVDDLGRESRREACGRWRRPLASLHATVARFPDVDRIHQLYLDALLGVADPDACPIAAEERAELLTLFLTTAVGRLEQGDSRWHLGVFLEQRVYWGVHRGQVDVAATALRWLTLLSRRMPDPFSTRHASALDALLSRATAGDEERVAAIRAGAARLARDGVTEEELLPRLVAEVVVAS